MACGLLRSSSSCPSLYNALHPLPLLNHPPPCYAYSPTRGRDKVLIVRADVSNHGGLGKKESSKWVAKGVITESLPNGMFWVRIENGDVVLGYISGKIRRNSIRMLPGDKVKIEVSRYDSTRGRIVYRMATKD